MACPGLPEGWNWKDCANAMGPVMTAVTVLLVLAGYGLAVTHAARDDTSRVLRATAAGFGAAAVLFCVLTHVTDPGMPRGDPSDPAPGDPLDEALRTREQRLPDGTSWKQKWCRECGLWRPHRCGHCHQCGRCVLRLDHHCAWMGTCVGERNARFFAAFLLCAGVGILALVALGLHRLAELGCLGSAGGCRGWEPLLIVFCFLCCPSPAPSICCSGVGLSCASVGYAGSMLADFDTNQVPRHAEDHARLLCRLLRCAGAKVYCCGPVAPKAPRIPSVADAGTPRCSPCSDSEEEEEPPCAPCGLESGEDADEASPLSLGDHAAPDAGPGATQLGLTAAEP